MYWKETLGIKQFEKEKKMLVDSRWLIQWYICIHIYLCDILFIVFIILKMSTPLHSFEILFCQQIQFSQYSHKYLNLQLS